MPTAWCPECRTEYREGVTVCADCGAALVTAEPPPAKSGRHLEYHEVSGPFLPEDDLVEVMTINAVEAELVAAQLRGAGIPAAVLGTGTAGLLITLQHVEGCRVMVRHVDLAGAETVVRELFGNDGELAPVDDEELGAQAEAATGTSDPSTGAVV